MWKTYCDFELEFSVDELFTALYGVPEALVLGQLFCVTVSHQQGTSLGQAVLKLRPDLLQTHNHQLIKQRIFKQALFR